MTSGAALIEGGIRPWGDRPALVLVPVSDEGVSWLHTVFTELSHGEGGEVLRIDAEPAVSLEGVTRVELTVSRYEPMKAVLTDGAGSITWTCNVAGWATVAGLLEPFLAGRPGHQYLHHGFGGADEADVVISFAETSDGR